MKAEKCLPSVKNEVAVKVFEYYTYQVESDIELCLILLIFAASAYGYFHGVTLLSKT